MDFATFYEIVDLSRQFARKIPSFKFVLKISMDPSFYTEYGFYITDDPDFINEKYNITRDIQELLEELFPETQKGKKRSIKKLERYCREYPHIPHFKNYLSVAYANAGNHLQARKVTEQILQDHPEYLFGKLNYANLLLEIGQPEKVPEVLTKDMKLSTICPDRTTFHYKEALVFGKVAARYFLSLNRPEIANSYVELMKKIGPDELETEETIIRYNRYLVEKANELRE